MRYVSGLLYQYGDFSPGWATIADGAVIEVGEGRCPAPPQATGLVVPPLTDAHTHCADGGVPIKPGMSLEQLVAPPNGLKHVYLRTTPAPILQQSMAKFAATARQNGIDRFLDFREGGVTGCRLLREVVPEAVIFGRPVQPDAPDAELAALLSFADGLSLSSLADVSAEVAERTAEAAHAAGRPFAIHVSERFREDIETVLALEPAFVVHMVKATDSDLQRCADEEVPIVVCPRSNRYFGQTPPLARMAACDCTVALGTDNAMLCTPDLRPEAAEAAAILTAQGGDPSLVWKWLFEGGRKILYRANHMSGPVEEDQKAAVVLPCPGLIPAHALESRAPVYRPL